MHTFGDTGAGVPAFLAKLWRLVEDPETNDLIYWSTDGRSFIIQNQARFSKELLPLNYKHNNMASFIRQLNMYGFHKITSIDNGGLRFDRDEMEFSHPCFQKGHPYLLEHIKRKIAHPKAVDNKESVKVEAVNKMLCEVKTMRGRQDALDSRFSSMKQENEALWREVAILRQKHMKQQQIVNKLIQFLVTMVQPSRSGLGGMGRRRYQLMINDAPRSSKVWLNNIIDILGQRSTSPIIHELEEELLDEAANTDETIINDFPHVTSPQGQEFTNSYSNYYQPSYFPTSSQATTPTLYDNVTQPQYNNCYVLDDESSGEMINGRQSTDYVVDHIDDYDLGETTGQRKRTCSTGDENLSNKVSRQQDGLTSVHDGQPQNVKSDNKAKAASQQSILKGQVVPTKGNKKPIKQEKDLYSYGKYEMNVPDISGSGKQAASTSPSSSTGSGKSFYSKDDLFTDEVPNELFGEDANTLLNNDDTPLLSATTLNNKAAQQIQQQGGPSTSTGNNQQSIILADGSNLQIAKFNGKSNTNDISRLNSLNEFDSHLNDVQTDLDALKDILRGDDYQFDASALLNNTGETSNYNRYFSPQNLDPAILQKLFNNEDIGAYELPNTGSVSTILPAASSPGSAVALTEYAPEVDLSDLLEMPSNDDFNENNQQALSSTRT